MLLSLLYHRVGSGKYSNPLPFFKEHFRWIQERYRAVLPGDALPEKNAICLTFDDAYYDFYHHVFPLLKKHNLKAVLAVPVGFIPEEVTLSSEKRLEEIITLPAAPDAPDAVPSPAHCTWDELREMHRSGIVHIASHSVNHVPLTAENVDPEFELLSSKIRLEKELGVPITTFAYPFGKFDERVHALAKEHYAYIMRIGNAVNFSWENTNQLIYRINADGLPRPNAPFHPLRKFQYLTRYFINTLRKK